MIFKPELSPQNFHYDVLYPLYSAFYNALCIALATNQQNSIDSTQLRTHSKLAKK
jgi:hypothetical protein